MGWFSKDTTTVALIDVSSSSIAGAYAHVSPGGRPIIYYSIRAPFETEKGTPNNEDLFKALAFVGEKMLTEGAPVLRRSTGNAHVEKVVISIGSPWQETKISTSVVLEKNPFLFTHALVKQETKKASMAKEGKIASESTLMAVLLNGYYMANPYGKKAKRVELMFLSSLLDASIVERVHEVIKKLYHTRDIYITAFAPVSYSSLQELYPYTKDFLTIQVSDETTDVSFVKNSLLAETLSRPSGLNALSRAVQKQGGGTLFKEQVEKAEHVWLTILGEMLRECAKKHPLPRTIFLICKDEHKGFLERMINNPLLHVLWLSEEPLSVIHLSSKLISSNVELKGESKPDLILTLMALAARKHNPLVMT